MDIRHLQTNRCAGEQRTTCDQRSFHNSLKPSQSPLYFIDFTKLLGNGSMLGYERWVVLLVVILTKPQLNHTIQRERI